MLVTNSCAAPMSRPRPVRVCATTWTMFGGSSLVVSKYKLAGSAAPPSRLAWMIVLQVTTAPRLTSLPTGTGQARW